jgi:hypothetical protein
MSKVDMFLSRLGGVRQTGPDRWIARCPAHDDKSPSLAVRETDDARILLHCFSGCQPDEVLAAVGMTFADLHPAPLGHRFAPQRAPFPARDVLACLGGEAMIVAAAGTGILAGKFAEDDRARLVTAVARIQAALTSAGVTP